MAEKKYIGKPGKQDDPCWKGYEMVGMKKKGGRKVPNCVPEATDIIAKAKAKIAEAKKEHYPREGFPEEGDYGYHPNPGLKPQESDSDEDMDKAYKLANEKIARKPLNAKITEENWMVKKGTEVVSTHKTKDEADVKAMKHPLYKVYAKEQTEHENCGTPDCCGQCDTAIEESISNMSDARLKYHATKDFPHGRYTSKEIKAEHNRRRKAVPNYHAVKASLNEEELEETYGMWKVDFPKQHVGKKVEAGTVHVKAQNVAHAHKVAAKRVGVDHKVFKSKVTKSSILPEELEDLGEGGVRPMGRTFAKYRDAKDTNSNFMNKWDRRYATPNAGPSKTDSRKELDAVYQSGVPITKVPTKNATSQTYFKTKFKGKLKEEQIDEVLGKSNEWGTDALRKKYAKVTPGQETMEGDQIPTFDPRYDDVTTQYCGGIREGYLAEISARGAEARAKFQAKIHKTLNDPAKIAKAKKALAKKAKLEKEKEPPHLVMQLRKAVSIGSKVHFRDGSHHSIAPNHADKFMAKYNSAKSSIEKEALQNRAHKSHAEFMKTIAEAMQTPQGSGPEHESHMGNGGYVEVGGQTDKPCTCDIAPANYPTPGQVSPEPELGDMNNDGEQNEWDEVAIEADVTNEIENSSWQDLMKYYDSEEDEGEDLEEAITPQGRLKKRFNAMRTKTRRTLARNMALKRIATPDKIKSRSIRAARRMVYQRLLRNRDISTVSAAEKSRLEAQVKRMAPTVARLSIRLQQKERKIDQQRVSNSRGKKKK